MSTREYFQNLVDGHGGGVSPIRLNEPDYHAWCTLTGADPDRPGRDIRHESRTYLIPGTLLAESLAALPSDEEDSDNADQKSGSKPKSAPPKRRPAPRK